MDARTIIVTGAASGIGRACAERLLRDGHNVVAVDLKQDALTRAFPGAPEAQLHLHAGDVARPDDCAAAVQAAVERFGALDGLIHCAAIHSPATWDALSLEELNRVLEVNVSGSFLMAQAAGRAMVEAGRGGAILLTSSSNVIAGGTGGQAGMGGPAYVASKSAIPGLVRSLARGLGPHNVRVNGIMPGVTETPMIAGYSPEQRAFSASRAPLGRIGEPEEIAAVCCFLVSPEASFVTGETMIANGGGNFG